MNYVKVAAHGFIKKGDSFLVTKRSRHDGYMPGLWDLPGGTIEFQEKAVDALRREIKEETGLEVTIGKVLFCYDYASGADRHQFQMVYECDYVSGEVRLSDDHEDYRWVSPGDVKSLEKIAFLDEFVRFFGLIHINLPN